MIWQIVFVIISGVITVTVGIISFFLKKVFDRIDSHEVKINTNDKKLAVIDNETKLKFNHIDQKLDLIIQKFK